MLESPPRSPSRHLSFSRSEWRQLARLYGVVAVLHFLGLGLFLHYAAHYPAMVGLGLVAYLFGLRHAFDADHIAAVDDTVRFLLQKGRNPLRRIFYNLTTTGLSIAVALLIGTVELLQVIISMMRLRGPLFDRIGGLDFGALGYVIVGLFLLAWGLSVAWWKFGRVSPRWGSGFSLHGDSFQRSGE
jgi:nickel/cobalt transporter (NiCoT) family protein